jgi:hypothetical protein
LPTALPRPPRVEQKRTVICVAFNAVMVVSALVLTCMVLVREHGYANGQPGIFAGAIQQMAQQLQPDQSGNPPIIPPSN